MYINWIDKNTNLRQKLQRKGNDSICLSTDLVIYTSYSCLFIKKKMTFYSHNVMERKELFDLRTFRRDSDILRKKCESSRKRHTIGLKTLFL